MLVGILFSLSRMDVAGFSGLAKGIETGVKGNVKGGGDASWQSGKKIRRKPG
jgi:hypothetical protein